MPRAPALRCWDSATGALWTWCVATGRIWRNDEEPISVAARLVAVDDAKWRLSALVDAAEKSPPLPGGSARGTLIRLPTDLRHIGCIERLFAAHDGLVAIRQRELVFTLQRERRASDDTERFRIVGRLRTADPLARLAFVARDVRGRATPVPKLVGLAGQRGTTDAQPAIETASGRVYDGGFDCILLESPGGNTHIVARPREGCRLQLATRLVPLTAHGLVAAVFHYNADARPAPMCERLHTPLDRALRVLPGADRVPAKIPSVSDAAERGRSFLVEILLLDPGRRALVRSDWVRVSGVVWEYSIVGSLRDDAFMVEVAGSSGPWRHVVHRGLHAARLPGSRTAIAHPRLPLVLDGERCVRLPSRALRARLARAA